MGKMKKSVKAIIISAVSILCVLAIVLGLVFGLKKPDDSKDNSKMTAAQQNLAKQINENSDVNDYAIAGRPYADDISSVSQLTRFGLNYYSFKTVSRERFFTYKTNSDGSFETDELTNPDEYNFVEQDAISTKVVEVTDKYVLFVSYFDLSPYATEVTRLRYSLVDYSVFDNPVEIFSFNSKLNNYYIPQNSFTLKENYFVFSYLTSLDLSLGTADLNFYAYPYSTSKIDYTDATSKNFVTGIKYDNATTKRTYSDNSFIVFTDNVYKVYYLHDGGFNLLEKEIESEASYILKDYSIKEVFDGKLLITETNHIADENDITDTSVAVGESGGAKSYVNYTYKMFDFSKTTPTETAFAIEKDYSVVYGQESANALDDYFYLAYEKVDEENELTGKYLIVYYDSNLNPVIKYSADKSNEELVAAGNDTFLTSNRIVEVDKNVNATEKYNFAKNNLLFKSKDIEENKVVVMHDNGFYGVIDFDGEIIIDAAKSNYSNITNIHNGKCIVNYGDELFLVYDFATKSEEVISSYIADGVLDKSDVGVYLAKESTDVYKLKDYSNNTRLNADITSYTKSSSSGVSFIEISTRLDKKPTNIILVADRDDIKHNYISFVSDVSGPLVADPSNDQSAQSYANTSLSATGISVVITQEKNPTITISMTDSCLIQQVAFNVHFFNDYTLTLFDMVMGGGVATVKVNYGGEMISHSISHSTSGNLIYKMQFDYTNIFGYGSVSIDSFSGTVYRNLCYYYFKRNNKTAHDENTNLCYYMTTTVTSDSVFYTTAFNGTTITAPSPASNIDTHNIFAWRYYGTSTEMYNFLGPTNFSSSSNVPASGAVSGASLKTAAYKGDDFTLKTMECFTSVYYYAWYAHNNFSVEINYQGWGNDYTITGSVLSSRSITPPDNRPGYNWVGWNITNMANITHSYEWVNTGSSGTFSGTSIDCLRLPSGASSTTIVKLTNLRKTSGTVVCKPVWERAIYTITLDNGDADISTGTQHLYEKYGAGIYFDFTCTNSYVMNNSGSLINLPSKTDYSFAGYFTKADGKGDMYIDPTGVRTNKFTNTKFTANATLYAYWTNIQYTIRYDNGYLPSHANYQTTSIPCFYGRVYSVALPLPTARPGYSFIGWAISGLDGSCDHYYGTTPTISSLKKITGTVMGVTVNLPLTTGESSNITHFYNLRSTEGEVVLVSRWKPNTYGVLFDLDGGTARGIMTTFDYNTGDYVYEYLATYDTEFTISGSDQPTKVGYNFAGWQVENMEVINGLEHLFTGSGVANLITTEASVDKLTPSYVNFFNLRQTDLSDDEQYVIITALWDEITYYVEFDLEGGEWKGNEGRVIFGMNDTGGAATPIKMNQLFGIPAPAVAPIGYKFESWLVSDDAYGGYEETPDYTGANWQFKKLSVIQDAVIVLTVDWKPITYNFHFEPGADYVTLNNTDSSVEYDLTFSANTPQRTGYSFLGWKLTNLSDKCTHYHSTTIQFESLNGAYVNPSNPNEYVATDDLYMNLHCEEGATVTLTAMWDYVPIDLNYYYADPDDFSSIPSETQVNTVENYSLFKTESVKLNNVFTTLTAASSEFINDGITLPTGFKLVAWVFTVTYRTHGSPGVTSDGTLSDSAVTNHNNYLNNRLDWNSQYLLSLENIETWFYNCPADNSHDINYVTFLHFDAYAVYQPVEITLKFYKASSESGYNDISSYYEDTSMEKNVEYLDVFTIGDSNLGVDGLGYMLSVNYLIDGNIDSDSSISSYMVDGEDAWVYFIRGEMTSRIWGIPNTWAYNPNDPVFYMYTVYATYEPEKLFTYAYNERLDGYTITGYDAYEYSRQYNALVYIKEKVELPSTYNDGVHGSKSVVAIGAQALAGFSHYMEIVIPSSIVEIGAYAFSGCLCSSITGGSGITRLDRYALSGIAHNIESIPLGSWKVYDYAGVESTFNAESSSHLTNYALGMYLNYVWIKA